MIINQAKLWRDSNDISSSTHRIDNEEVIHELVLDGKLLDKEADDLECELNNLWFLITKL